MLRLHCHLLRLEGLLRLTTLSFPGARRLVETNYTVIS